MRDYAFFKAHELECPCGQCDGGDMDDQFMRRVIKLRQLIRVPLLVTSGYRCPAYNAKISGTGRVGPHTTGHALDVAASGEFAIRLLRLALIDTALMGGKSFTGIGIKQHGDHKSRFIHLDDLEDDETPGPRPWIWTYK